MDDLGYGLSEPKLVLLQDGSVFVAGQVQAPMEAPAVIAQAKMANKLMVADSLSNLTLLIGSPLFGMVATNNKFEAYPEEAALGYWTKPSNAAPGISSHLIPVLNSQPDSVGNVPLATSHPAKARISIPLPGEANHRHRFFILKIPVDSMPGAGTVTGISVKLQFAGGPSQDLLGTDTTSEPLSNASPFWFDGTPNVIEQQEYDASQAALDGFAPSQQQALQQDENTREQLRLQWLTQTSWIDTTHFKYFFVRVTMAQPSQIQYGPGVLPPTGRMSYRFRLWYSFNGTANEHVDISPCGDVQLVPEWNTRQSIIQTFGTGSTQVKLQASSSLLAWLQQNGHVDLLGPVNEITLEHGRNTGHGAEHLRGEAIDIFHPGYAALPSDISQAGAGAYFMDTIVRNLFNQAINNTDPVVMQFAQQQLAIWIQAARNSLQQLLSQCTDSSGNIIGDGFYLQDSNANANSIFYSAIRDLIWNGISTRQGAQLDLRTKMIGPIPLGSWQIADQNHAAAIKGAIKPDPYGHHNNHIHVRPQGRLLNQ